MALLKSAFIHLEKQIKSSKHLGCALAVTDTGSEHFAELGFADHLKETPLRRDHLFEIGSISKPFVGLLFSKLHLEKELSLETSISSILSEIKNEAFAHISIRELLTHTSGLPRLPQNLSPTNELDPYANYTRSELYEELNRIVPTEKTYCYSNLGFAILGEILERQQGKSLESLLKKEIFTPLELNDTFISFNDPKMKKMSEGHLADLRPVAHWNMNIFSAAGEIKSSIVDLLKFVQGYLHPEKTNLAEAIKLSGEVHHSQEGANLGLAWHISSLKPKILIHEGGTFGFRGIVLISPEENKGLIALSNTGSDFGDLSSVF